MQKLSMSMFASKVDYDKAVKEQKKLTFEEWWESKVKETGYSDPWQDSYEAAKDAWKAAQENK